MPSRVFVSECCECVALCVHAAHLASYVYVCASCAQRFMVVLYACLRACQCALLQSGEVERRGRGECATVLWVSVCALLPLRDLLLWGVRCD